MSVYESIPQRVEAIQWDGSNHGELVRFGAIVRQSFLGPMDLLVVADGAQSYVPLPVGHWIVRAAGDLSDYWPVEDEHFRDNYRQVDE